LLPTRTHEILERKVSVAPSISAPAISVPVNKRMRRPMVLACLLLVLVVCAAVVFRTEPLRLRVSLGYLAARGEIVGLNMRDAAHVGRIPSPYWLAGIVISRNAYRTLSNPYTDAGNIAAGAATFSRECASCHGPHAGGSDVAPALVNRQLRHGGSDWAVFQTIRNGIAGTSMPPHDWTDVRIWQTIAYLSSIGAQELTGSQPTPADEAGAFSAPVSYDQLRRLENPGPEWLTYAGSYAATRHSELRQITAGNIERLAPRWVYQFPHGLDRMEVSPIVRNGVMYASSPQGVVALDARTGETKWEYLHAVPPNAKYCCGQVNRGLAILGSLLYVGTADAHLIALSAETGRVQWDVAVAPDYQRGYSITGAPLAFENLVVTGVSGGDYPTRGFIAAFDATTGKERWRFWTVPGPGEPGAETWSGDSARAGGGGAWMTGAYDPKRDILYWGIGNPAPDFDASNRRGDNLYTDSVVALRGKDGKKLWHFQFTPNDDHDWDSAQTPTLIDRPQSSSPEQLLLANRNGFFYALDRVTGRFLHGNAFVQQNWAKGLDAQGRPILNPNMAPSPRGTLVYPGVTGASNWWATSYDAGLDLLFVPALEKGSVFFTQPEAEGEGELSLRGSASENAPGPQYSSVIALNPTTGAAVWKYRRPLLTGDDIHRSGILSTEGGVLFTSQSQTFYALESRTGRLLWTFPTGGRVGGAPVSYELGGNQYVLIATGTDLIAFALTGSGSEPRQ
jgi:alcohol dehydrogenase (cytochrome c)